MTVHAAPGKITAVRLEALDDAGLPKRGPGTATNGNFVLTEFKVSATGPEPEAKPQPVRIRRAVADFSQDGHAVATAIDGKDDTGWAILPAVGATPRGGLRSWRRP